MLCIINCQYTHNQGKFCQNFQFFHMYTSFSVNLHHFTVAKPKFRSKLPKFRSEKPKFRSECNEISFFEFKNTFRSELPKFSEISPEIPFPPDGGIPRHACLFKTRLVKLTTFILCTCSRLSLTDEHNLLGPCIQDINRGEHRYLLESW